MSVRRNDKPVKKRGREARLKREHAHLYPGLDPGAWIPVEDLLHHITELIHQDRTKAKVITGTRLLHQGHFDFRGSSSRPDGLPSGATRISDSGLEPSELEAAPGPVSEKGAEPEGGMGGRNS